MLIPIPIGTKHTAVMEGSAPVLALCEQCGQEYVYTVERAGQGEALNLFLMDEAASRASARQEAERSLAEQLRYAVDPVPCPCCGTYQAAMVRGMRESRFQWMLQFGIILCALSPILLFAALIITLIFSAVPDTGATILIVLVWLATLTAIAAGPALLVFRSVRWSSYNPNDEDVEARKAMGHRLAVPRDEYVKTLRELRKKHLI